MIRKFGCAKARRNRILSGVSRLLPLLAVGLTISAAHASDLPSRLAPPSPPVPTGAYSWTGVYVGAQVGYGSGRDKTTDVITATGGLIGLSNAYTTKGVMGGIAVGADYQYGMLVGGVVGDIELSDLHGGFNAAPGSGAPFDPGGISQFKVSAQGSLRGRLGVAFDRFLIYGTGGLAVAGLKYSYFNPSNSLSENKNSSRAGWTAGVGVAYAVTDNIVVDAEYRRTDFGTFDNVSTLAYPGISGRQEPRFNAGRVGVRYKF